jgi:hypothetical protein
MYKSIFFSLLFFASQFCFSQKSIQMKDFSKAQKEDWDAFYEFYNGNGNGTCMPIMEAQIDTGKCTTFDFVADLYVGKNGRIYKVVVIESNILCENKAIQQDVLDCFISTLKEEWTVLKMFKRRVIKNASL